MSVPDANNPSVGDDRPPTPELYLAIPEAITFRFCHIRGGIAVYMADDHEWDDAESFPEYEIPLNRLICEADPTPLDDLISVELARASSVRFRKVSNRYARRVVEAYDLDIQTAIASTDEEVAERVAAWERAQGLEPVDWPAIGAEERG